MIIFSLVVIIGRTAADLTAIPVLFDYIQRGSMKTGWVRTAKRGYLVSGDLGMPFWH